MQLSKWRKEEVEWIISVFLEEFLLTLKGNILKKYSEKKRVKSVLKIINDDFKEKYELEVYFNHLDGFFATNKTLQKFVRKCLVMWKATQSNSKEINKIADSFVKEYPQYSPYRTKIYNIIKELFEKCFNEINSDIKSLELQKATNSIFVQNDRNTMGIKDDIKDVKELIEGVANSEYKKKLSVDNRKKIMGFSIVDRSIKGSIRKDEVTFILGKLKEMSWIHIWGEVWSGKTQFLKLISDRVYNYKYIDLDQFNSIYNIEELYIGMAEVCGCTNIEKEKIIDLFLLHGMSEGVLFIDGIHEAALNDKIIELISLFSIKCNESKIKLITCGYSDISKSLRNYCDVTDCFIYRLPGLSEQEVTEIMFKNNMPQNTVDKKIAKFLSAGFGNIPALVMELIFELKEKRWVVDEDYFTDLLMAKSDNVEIQLERIIFSRILDENVRKLLYRIAGVGHDVPVKVLNEIGEIEPKIKELDKARYIITSRWGIEKEGMISLPRVFTKVANKYLTESEKEELHIILINFYKETKILDEIAVINLISHLSDLRLYNELGELYINVLASMMDQNIKDDPCYFATFWSSLKLPEEMSVSIKAMIRMAQVRYLAFADKKYVYQLDELLKIVDSNHECGQFLLMLMPLLNSNDFNSHNKCMKKCLELNLWDEVDNELKVEIDRSNMIEWAYPDMSVFDLFIMKYSMLVSNVQEFKIFVLQLKRTPLQKLQKLLANAENVPFVVLERVRINLTDHEKEEYKDSLISLRSWAKETELDVLYWKANISFLRYLFETRKLYEDALKFFEKNKSDIEGERYHEFVDAMAKLLYECRDKNVDKKLIRESYNSLPDISKEIFEDIYTCIMYMDIASLQENKDASKRMLEYALQPDKIHMDFSIYARAKSEYYINAYMNGHLKDVIIEFSEFVFRLVQDIDIPKRKVIIPLLVSDVLYMVSDIVYQTPPITLPNGESYAVPKRGRYWIIQNEDKVESLFSEDNEPPLLLMLAQLLEYYGYVEIADDFCKNIFSSKEITKPILSNLFVFNSYLLLTLAKHKKWKIICWFIEYLNDRFISDNDISVPIKTLLIISAYLADISKSGDFNKINLEKICLLEILNVKNSWKRYFIEYCKIVKVFVYEEGDTDILLECANKISNTDLDLLRGAIYILMYTRTSKENKIAIQEIIKKVSVDMRLGIEKDYFFYVLLKKETI